MDENNPNRSFRLKKITEISGPLTREAIARGREVIASVKTIRTVTGAGLKEAREAITEAEWDVQVAIERIKLKQAAGYNTDEESMWELEAFEDFISTNDD